MRGFPLRRLSPAALAAAAALALVARPSPAAPARFITNIAALHAFPEFYQNRQIQIDARLSRSPSGTLLLSAGGNQLPVLFDGTPPADGLVEAHGEFWNIGGMQSDDPRLRRPGVERALGLNPSAPWPRSGTMLALDATTLDPVSAPATGTIRTIELDPDRFLGQSVTITGQFSGRNLFGELPDAPGVSRYDFVLRDGDAALWITGMPPKGKGFDLNPDLRLDTTHWLQVTGIVHQGRGLVWIEANKDGIQEGRPPTTTSAAQPPGSVTPVPVPAFAPPEAIFSAPTDGETDVALTTDLRIQFSRDLDPSTLKGNVHIGYLTEESVERGEPTTPAIGFTFTYDAARRELTIHFNQPLLRFRTVKVELTSGIRGADHQPLEAWTMSFTLGG